MKTQGSCNRKVIILALFLLQSLVSVKADPASYGSDLVCGPLETHFGPWDYNNPKHIRERLPVVERNHFDVNVESLVKGTTAVLPGGDLDYTLRAFPNHHRALYSMGRYALRYPTERIPPGAEYSGDCYFVRAVRFKPEDAVVRIVFGIYLSLQEKYPEAIEQLQVAVNLVPGNSEAHYNLALVLEKSDRLDEALEHAKIAYKLGFPLDGLKNKLRRRGTWTED